MNAQILTTKLYIPVSRSKTVPRPRLFERLNEGLDRKLTLVSASAGFGKTTLIGEWAAGCGRPVAWLSLDERDNDATRFLTHLVAAVNRVAEPIGGDGALPRMSQPSSTESALTILLNEVSSLPTPFVLVLDDFHVIRAKPIDDAVAFLLEHLPPQMHLIIATREDPQLPLSRLRVRGDLTELRAADLRFSAGEAAAFFNEAMGLALSADDIAALESRAEGWIAGLQLAALSMRGREDIPAFIRAFAGDNRYIIDYLVEEVLRRQPESMRRFLLQTSILERLSGPLCDAVTGEGESIARLEALEKGNFFVVPLDDRREWYRYHHLFGEVLAVHLKADQPDRAAELHRRASLWYEQRGSAADAIRHALAAGDVARAADLIELAWPAMRRLRQGLAVLGWLRALPDELVRARPVLSVEFAWALMAGGEFAAVEERLRDAERWLETTASSHASMADRVVVDEEEFSHLPGTIAGYRAARAQVLGDIPAAIQYARRVLELVPEGDHLRRGAAAALLGLAAWTSGDLETAYRMFDDGMAGVLLAGNISDAIGGTIALADIRIAQGRLRQAMRVYERGLELAEAHGERMSRGTIDIHVAMSELSREHNDLQAAADRLLTGKELSERALRPQVGSRWHVAMARIAEANEDLHGALSHFQEAERLYKGHFFPNVRPVSAMKTRVWLGMGKLDDALDWVREQGLSVEDELSYLREFEHVTLARALLAKYRRDRTDHSISQVLGLLERLLQAAEEGGRTGSAIEILILQAMAHDAQGNRLAALGPLERALAFAESEGYVRVFADEGEPMAALLEAALKQGVSPGYIARLLSAFGRDERRATPEQALSEPLSDRELEVLRLFRTELSGPDMARMLHISLNTLRSHTKNIYSKLEVNNRRAAVRRLEELELD
ncbi:LuxR family transcriptional regulator, maltose regulon positive regulatory protein [Cohnella sp. OV330]|uniref:LuxR C-terminal-related transcriptional regulator n=1 Tax=Cohnella sp. OV330 TaxID=1855288 RepID=UPI0008E7626C|nr:LuxR C-terminal-related transcriptional regulator [Cohnella sp. OV330]SFB50192.1 LuxR family transcriptional regulator, maltose regulon positive regulatory protein [Cohnella sp. OV330]